MDEHAPNTSSSRRIASTYLLARGSLALAILVATVAAGIGGLAAPVAAEEITVTGQGPLSTCAGSQAQLSALVAEGLATPVDKRK